MQGQSVTASCPVGQTCQGDQRDGSPPRKARAEVLCAIWGPTGVPGAPAKRRRQPCSMDSSPMGRQRLFQGRDDGDPECENTPTRMRTPVGRRRAAPRPHVDGVVETPAKQTRAARLLRQGSREIEGGSQSENAAPQAGNACGANKQ
mmetsp:Transcript_103146/g.204900  ORF Transcript_103146/g.204900 Transcript_103146/m.204900 type:complete len:147 (+) Transcript_103146:46-486(+)|eukprot:CAMPEP_0172866938 /NCGR_PEP_ID=MMETSP1075-20121228/82269_1 /TAXON_ID=2916 /ORGANISM="Ceratium fusus, Strain PA161109" /LENGTH=146 /DNA_ID=CAMNT_0013716155 /DNA_START=43 /DNA_END=483 /DNA_ORIENTATION=+